MAVSARTPDIMGERLYGQDVRTQNVMACQAVANIVKSSLGPVGLDKEHQIQMYWTEISLSTDSRGEAAYYPPRPTEIQILTEIL
ncbi:unnamed protein product [Camellia sinensis]